MAAVLNAFDEFDEAPAGGETTPAAPSNPFDEFDEAPAPAPSSFLRRAVADTGVSLAKSAVGLGEAAVGALDIPTGGYAGKALEGIGYRPQETHQALEELYSPEQQAANRAVSEAKGFGGTIAALARNPSVILQKGIETVPLMAGGGAVARAATAIPALAKLSPLARGAIGEGVIGAGLAAEQTRQQTPEGTLSLGQTGLAATSGAITGALTRVGGAAAKKLGVSDLETLFAGGGLASGTAKRLAARVAGGAAAEGIFEELPQSAQEQVLANIAIGKGPFEGVPEAAAMGAVLGGVMGGAVAGFTPGRAAEPPPGVQPPPLAEGAPPAPEWGTEPGVFPQGQPLEPGRPAPLAGQWETAPGAGIPPGGPPTPPPAGPISRALSQIQPGLSTSLGAQITETPAEQVEQAYRDQELAGLLRKSEAERSRSREFPLAAVQQRQQQAEQAIAAGRGQGPTIPETLLAQRLREAQEKRNANATVRAATEQSRQDEAQRQGAQAALEGQAETRAQTTPASPAGQAADAGQRLLQGRGVLGDASAQSGTVEVDAGGGAQPGVRQEGGGAAVRGAGVLEGRRETEPESAARAGEKGPAQAQGEAAGGALAEAKPEAPPKGTKQSKGIYYFPTDALAREYAVQVGAPSDRIIEYGKGHAIQLKRGGNYVGPSYQSETIAKRGGKQEQALEEGQPSVPAQPPKVTVETKATSVPEERRDTKKPIASQPLSATVVAAREEAAGEPQTQEAPWERTERFNGADAAIEKARTLLASMATRRGFGQTFDDFLAQHPDEERRHHQIVSYLAAKGAATPTQQAYLDRATPSIPSGKPEAPERRADISRRQTVSDMSPEEMRVELLTDPLTGLGNRRAYDEAEKLPVQVSIDLDNLKFINDTLGHSSGDIMLKAFGEAFAKTSRVFRLGGDEFVLQAYTAAQARLILKRIGKRLARARIEVTHPDGTIVAKTGIGFSYGLGGTYDEADAALGRHKTEREATGERAARGAEPPGVERTGVAKKPAEGEPREPGGATGKVGGLGKAAEKEEGQNRPQETAYPKAGEGVKETAFEPREGWERFIPKAREYAKALGIDFQGKGLAVLAGEIKAKVAAHAGPEVTATAALPAATAAEHEPKPKAAEEGNEATVKTGTGRSVKTRYAIVEAADLVASNDDAGRVNPNYPGDLQPRDRGRVGMQAQVVSMAAKLDPARLADSPLASQGAPVTGPGGVVESGNGRTMAIRRAYAQGNAATYRRHLEEQADRFGLTREAVARMREPALIRERTSALSDAERLAFVREANQSDVAVMSPIEQAFNDASRLNEDIFALYRPSEDGDILARTNEPFVRQFLKDLSPEERNALMTADGRPTKQLVDRIQAAVFARAYNDERLLGLLAEEADPDIKNIITALVTAAPAFVRARAIDDTLGTLNIIPALVEGADIVREGRRKNQPVSEILAQQGLFDAHDPNAMALALFMDNNKRSPRRFGEGFRVMAEFIENEIGRARNQELFAAAPPTLGDLIGRANDFMRERYAQQEAIQPDLFTQPERDAPAAEARPEGRQPAEGERAATPGAAEAQVKPEAKPAEAQPSADKTAAPTAPTEAEVDAMLAKDSAAAEEERNRPGRIDHMVVEKAKRELAAGRINQTQYDNVIKNHGEAAAQYATKENAKEKPTPAAKEAIKHEDVTGEKIGGSRADIWKARGLRLSDLEGMSGGEEAQYVTKDNVWPATDYAKLIEDGADPKAAALVKILRDRLAAKPKKDTPEGRRHYVEMLGHVREELEKVKTVEDVRKVSDHVFAKIGWTHGDDVKRARGNLREREIIDEMRAKAFSVYKTRKNPLTVTYSDQQKAVELVDAGWPKKTARATRFIIREATDGTFRVVDKNTHRVQSKDLKTKEDATAWIEAQYKRAKDTLPERPHLDEVHRTGEDRRAGRDVTGDDFLKDFGFRGVEHGLWAAQDERQKALNLAYDALHDMAGVLGVPPKALSLNGTLGLAFGARGSGRFAAHYEPGKLVINLTKIRGAGTLSHEWAHGLDHYFGELGRPNSYQGAARGASGWYKRQRLVDRANLRPEMAKSFDNLMGAIFERHQTQAEAVRDQELTVERSQAAIAKQEERVKAARALIDNPATSDFQRASSQGFVKESNKWLADARRTLEISQRRLATLRIEPKPEGGYGKVMSSFYAEGLKLSGKSGEKGYWTRPTELFARAFEAYVFDKIGDKGNVSQYLVQGVEPERYAEGYKGNPYPAGLDREGINAAFDALFETMESRETENGAALYSRATGPAFGQTPGLFEKPDVRVIQQTGLPFPNAEAALRYALNRLRGSYRNRDTGWDISVARAGLEKALSHSGRTSNLHLNAVRALPGLLDHAVLAESKPDAEGDANIRAIHRFYAPLRVGKSLYQVKLTVKETTLGQKFYDQSLTEIEAANVQLVGEDQSPQDAQGTRTATGPLAVRVSIADLLRGAARDSDGRPFEPAEAKYSYLGERGAKTPKHALAAAREFAEQGVPMEEIRKTTGWFKGKDSRWRWELSDKDAKLKEGWDGFGNTIGDVLTHPTLFENYPSLRQVELQFAFKLPANVHGGFDPKQNAIVLNENLTQEQALSTILHEIAHIIQAVEGFARGGNPTDKDFVASAAAIGIDTADKKAMTSAYRRLLGEVEARDVQARAGLTAEELRERPPYESQGIPEEDFIIRREGEGMSLSEAAGQSTADLRAGLVRKLGARAIAGLEAAGFEIVENEGGLPPKARPPTGEAVRGVYFEGKSYLVAGNIPAGTETAVLLHEVGVHQGLEGLLGKKLHAEVIGQIQRILSPLERAIADGNSEAELSPIRARIARLSPLGAALVEARGRVPNGTAAEHVTEETLAYLVELRANHKLPLVRRILAAIRAFLLRKGIALRNINHDDLVALARVAVRRVSRGETVTQLPVGIDAGSLETLPDSVSAYTKLSPNSIDAQAAREQVLNLIDRQQHQLQRFLSKTATGLQTGIDIKLPEALPDSAATDAELFGDSRTAQAILEHGFDALDRKNQEMVFSRVVSAVHDPEVSRAIIKSVTVPVMNMFMGKKGAIEDLLHDPTMLSDQLSVASKEPITGATSRFIEAVAAAKIVFAIDSAKQKLASSVGPTGLSVEGSTAGTTMDYRHGISPEQNAVSGAPGRKPGAPILTRASALRGLPLFARGHDQTETPAFKRWFGDSRVVDENSEPLRVYHGTADSFSEFELERPNRKDTGWLGEGFYFSSNPDTANAYTVMKGGVSPNVMPVYLKIENPYYATVQEKERIMLAEKRGDREAARKRTEELIKQGHDGIVLNYGEYAKETEYVAFRPEQIKSATGNTGAFDPANPDIRYSRAAATLPGIFDNGNAPTPPNPFTQENRRLREEDKTVWDRAKKFWIRNFLPGGLLPEQVFNQKIIRDNELGVVEFDSSHLVGQLDHAVKKVYGKRMEELRAEERGAIQEALTGKQGSLDPRVRTVIDAMRQHVDRLSVEYVAILERQAQELSAGFDAGERALYDAFIQAQDVIPASDSPADKGLATKERNRILDEAKEAAKAVWGEGQGMQAALGRVAEVAARVSLMRTITGNVGRYVHRSYRAFDDPQWFAKLPDEVIDNARAYLRERYMEDGTSDDEADAMAERALHTIVKTGTAYDSMESFIREGKLGAKDLSILQRRKDIAPQIRALLGEYDDPRLNYAKSTTKMARLIWNTRFLERVREIGMGTFLFEERDATPGATTKIAADSSEVYAPLNGLWTFPEIEQAFKDALAKEKMADWYRIIVQMNGLVKIGKTILSPTTAARNWMSAMFFSLANGHFDMRHVTKSISGLREQFGHGNRPAELEYLRKLKRLGVVYDTAAAGEMMQLIKDSRIDEIMADKKSGPYRMWRDFYGFAKKAYQYGDDFWKIIGYENEKASLMKTGLTEEKAEVEAAERIRNTYPTYSMVGRGVKWLARFPLTGAFVSFPAEIIRTTVNMLQYTAKDFKDPARRGLALRRAAGMAMVSSFAYALQAMSMAAAGMDDDDEEAVRRLAAPWQKNSNFLFTGRDEKGQLRYFDLSFLDPYNWWKRPITAMLRDQPWEDKAAGALKDMLSPFLGADIAAGALFEVLANKKASGGQVYNKFGTPIDQSVGIANHLRKALQPGFVSNLERTSLAMKGEYTPSGKQYSLADEGMSWIGFRVTTLEPKTALYYRSFEFTDAKAAATATLTRVLRSPNEVSSGDIRTAREEANRELLEGVRDMRLIIEAARKSGMSRPETIRVLRTSGISLRDVGLLMSQREPKVILSPQQLRNAQVQARALYGPSRAAEIRERYREAASPAP
ncbi:hypothetical protein BH20PSE1_BH20PSE1_00880 [soil metagenome]